MLVIVMGLGCHVTLDHLCLLLCCTTARTYCNTRLKLRVELMISDVDLAPIGTQMSVHEPVCPGPDLALSLCDNTLVEFEEQVDLGIL